MTDTEVGGVQRIIYPPVWMVIGLASIFFLQARFPGWSFVGFPAQMLGGAFIVAGLGLLVHAGGLFHQAKTDLVPFKNVTALVTTGIYAYSRNPMYLGMALVLLGTAITVGSTTALLVPVVFVAIITVRFVRPEERMLQTLFPDEFPDYCRRVRRWL